MTQRRRCRFRRRRSLFAWAGPTVIEIEARSGPASAKVTRAGREAHERRPEHGAVGVERLQFLKPVRLKRLRLEILEFDPPSQKSGEKGSKDAIHMVSAFAARQRLALAQTKVRDKSTEIVAPCSTCCRSRAPSSSSMRSDASARLRGRSSTRSSSPVRGLAWLAVCSRDREPNVRSLSFFCLDRRHEHFEPASTMARCAWLRAVRALSRFRDAGLAHALEDPLALGDIDGIVAFGGFAKARHGELRRERQP